MTKLFVGGGIETRNQRWPVQGTKGTPSYSLLKPTTKKGSRLAALDQFYMPGLKCAAHIFAATHGRLNLTVAVGALGNLYAVAVTQNQ